jgi:hypothetical protein
MRSRMWTTNRKRVFGLQTPVPIYLPFDGAGDVLE